MLGGGGGGSPFGIAGNLMGSVLGGLSSSTSFASNRPSKGGNSTTINNNSGGGTQKSGSGINPGQPAPAIDNMFARLFDGSSMFG
jgi:hypothetical protein